ncbi:S9 family peptidase [Amycolatopsis sp. FDAARGOS 1241]|uniref:alpha/beta hydrolase family protein n=1 Tax=Amycolatopsis sp. FDAARGOS 1241 TaxID=2778070 RepID=UPI0019516A83|nr:alpha/beta hydrolase [Amycolatopsis sp. FDAARGOS 1241]QRP45056.1 alpha/beta fold hydrolase [Amycolatopsis sp. FDAARGOS 1241]
MADPAKVFFRDRGYDGQFTRTLNAAVVHAADLGEAFATARRVGKLTGVGWYDAWSATADRARAAAGSALTAGDRVSARHAFLRASEYHRQAYFFLRSDLDDPRLQSAYRGHVEAFAEAAKLLDHPAEAVRIPYADTTLHGYLFAPHASRTPQPTVVLPCGYDSTSEAGWLDVPAAIARGCNALVFDGPGQGETLYTQRRFLRPDFEHVLSPVLDWLLARPEADPAKVVLFGRSFAGYLAPRAATAEHRLAALVCDPAQPDLGARVPTGPAGLFAVPLVRAQMRRNPNRAEFFGSRMAAHGISSVREYFAEMRRYTMLADAANIRCPTLLIESEHDFTAGGGAVLRDAMKAPVRLVRLTETEGVDGHCAGMGQQVWTGVVYSWLHDVLA